MRDARLPEVAFCLIASACVLFAQGVGQGQGENSRPEANISGATSASKTVPGEDATRQAVTVAQLTEAIETAKDKTDEDAVKEIEHLDLTERLSSPELARLSAEMPGAGSKAALMVVGVASVFLESPQGEMLNNAAPDTAEQRQIVSRAANYLKTIIPKLPDFYARRITKLFEEEWTAQDKKGTHNPRPLHLKGSSHATVLYRNGKEDVRAEGAESGSYVVFYRSATSADMTYRTLHVWGCLGYRHFRNSRRSELHIRSRHTDATPVS
jgi:hypothetical protein